MEWTTPSFPRAPRDEPGVRTVTGAYLSKVEHGPLRTYGFPTRYLRGAVYTEDLDLVVESQKIGLAGFPWVPADPARYEGNRDPRTRLEGRWLYGGHWIQHFGHFMIETITTLWPDPADVGTGGELAGLVFHKYMRRRWDVEPYQQRVLELLGLGDLPVRVVGEKRPVRVDELVVPTRSVVSHGWAHPQAAQVWRRVAAPFRDDSSPSHVFVSRTRFNAEQRRSARAGRTRTTAARDAELDRVFGDAGFAVVAPETLPIDEQLRLFANARVLAGGTGSALHMSAFAPEGARVVEVGDRRHQDRPHRLQQVIDAATGHRHHFVPAGTTADDLAARLATLDEEPSAVAGPAGSAGRWRRWLGRPGG